MRSTFALERVGLAPVFDSCDGGKKDDVSFMSGGMGETDQINYSFDVGLKAGQWPVEIDSPLAVEDVCDAVLEVMVDIFQ